MEIASLNLNLLLSLDALLEEGSVTRAARRLGVTQSAMSQNLAQLRRHFGDPLLVRSGGRMLATPRALRLAPRLRRALLDLEDLVAGHDGEFDPATERRQVVIAAPDGFALVLLPELASTLAEEAPGVTVTMAPVPARLSGAQLESGELHFIVHVAVDRTSGIRAAPLFRDRLVVMMRRGHPRAPRRGRKLGIRAFCETPQVVVATGDHLTRSFVDEALEAMGRTRRVAMRVPYFLAAPFIVAHSDLLWCGPERSVVDAYEGLLPVEVFTPPFEQSPRLLHLFWHDRFTHDSFHQWFRTKLMEIVARRWT